VHIDRLPVGVGLIHEELDRQRQCVARGCTYFYVKIIPSGQGYRYSLQPTNSDEYPGRRQKKTDAVDGAVRKGRQNLGIDVIAGGRLRYGVVGACVGAARSSSSDT
jgi:hypothetical protein